MSETFDELADFINHKMRMSQVYQPIMLLQMLENQGQATVTDIAKAIVIGNPRLVQQYEKITRRNPGRVLTEQRGIAEMGGDVYKLKGFEDLTESEVQKLIAFCHTRLAQFLEKRNEAAA